MSKKSPPRNRGKDEPKTEEGKISPRDVGLGRQVGHERLPKTEEVKISPRDSAREMIESVVIAFVLAFLFRTFEAEAFVIPTGSMAPTLMGQHKDLRCAKCGYAYRVSASEEESRRERPPQMVTASVCPICRYQMNFRAGGPDESVRHATYKGDRILVAKFPYEFSDPERWDVAVFKNPGEAKQNYIKRVVGLPNETVVVCHGDIHSTHSDLGYGPLLDATAVAKLQRDEKLRIESKPPEKVEAMLQVVHDNDYLPPGLPLRWEAQTAGWETLDEGKGFAYDGKLPGDAVLVYRHLVPPPEFWSRRRADDDVPPAIDLQPQLITDFYSYNTSEAHGGYPVPAKILGNHWVGDLAVECRAEVQGGEGELILQLVEGGVVFECRIDVATGKAVLGASDDDEDRREAQTAVRGEGSYRLRFANVDDQLLLWVNGKVVRFDGHYARLEAPLPDAQDLTPVRVGTKGLAARFSELRVLRDVYYIAVDRDNPNSDNSEYLRSANFFYDPLQWKELAGSPAIVLPLSAGQYMVCGDNSPRSYDSRMWRGVVEDTREPEYYVKRDLLIGKAVYIYWPHALPIPGLPDKWWFQLIPNVPRMGFVR